MAPRREITLRVHGLEHQKDAVDARVFAIKLSSLVRGLKHADKLVNGRNSHAFIIAGLSMGSATARIREQQANLKYTPSRSSVGEFYNVAGAVYNSNLRELNGSSSLVSRVRNLAVGAAQTFSHIELFVDDLMSDALRFDDFYLRQADSAVAEMATLAKGEHRTRYKGVSFGTFDGRLKLVDLRGLVKHAKLTLTAGGAEIDCVCNEIAVPELGDNLDKRAIVEGVAHYDGVDLLPVRLDIKKIHQVKADSDLKRWKGAFSIPENLEDW